MKIATLLVVAAMAATAQVPVPFPIGECATGDIVEDETMRTKMGPQRHEFRLPSDFFFVPGNFCSFYAKSGWEETMKFQLGEGASEYRDLIERAVEVWNETVNLPSGGPLIEISDERPTTYRLQRSFWPNSDEYGRENLDDDENVIYFTPSGDGESTPWGTTWLQRGFHPTYHRPAMLAADVYINTAHEEEFEPDVLVLTKRLVDVDSSYGAYALVNKTYAVILHEIGHAVGLSHIPVSGNVMSRDFGAGGIDQWADSLRLLLPS